MRTLERSEIVLLLIYIYYLFLSILYYCSSNSSLLVWNTLLIYLNRKVVLLFQFRPTPPIASGSYEWFRFYFIFFVTNCQVDMDMEDEDPAGGLTGSEDGKFQDPTVPLINDVKSSGMICFGCVNWGKLANSREMCLMYIIRLNIEAECFCLFCNACSLFPHNLVT